MNRVSATGIGKSYGPVKALDNISFDVAPGEIFGIIGPDGAGKTTLFRILTTLLAACAGVGWGLGVEVVKEYVALGCRVGYRRGPFSLYRDLSVEENLRFFASVFNTTVEANYHLVADIYRQLAPFSTRKAAQLSGGMKQKLALCCALIHKPEVLFLDEPTTGVDPVSRKEFWEMLMRLRADGLTILVSTPYMDEASLCDRIALIQSGRFLKIETPRRIVAAYPRKIFAVSSSRMHDLLRDLRAYAPVGTAFSFGAACHVTFAADDCPAALEAYLTARGHSSLRVEEIEPTVEDCFMLLSKTPDDIKRA